MPARSTGCLTCRKRKIRCDEGRPGCERCATHGVLCPGYRQDRPVGIEFKDQTNITAKRAEQRYKNKGPSVKSKGSENSSPDGRLLDLSPSTLDYDASTTTTEADSLSDQQKLLVIADKKAATFPTRVLSPTNERAQIYQEFMTSYFPKRRFGSQSGYWNFFQAIAVKRSNQPVLEQSMDALSLVQLGSCYKDPRLVKEAGTKYGVALRSLANSIARGDFMHDDDVLAAVACLSICELFEEIANMGEGWAKHIQGSNVLFAARGPDSFTSDLALLIYSNVKHGSLLYALISRKTPFLAGPEWRKLAHVDPDKSDHPEILFYDIAMDVPSVLQAFDELDMNSPTAPAEIDKALQGSIGLEAKMRTWWSEWQDDATVENMVDCELRPIEEFTIFASLVADRTFDHAYRFPDFQTAWLHSLYWMVMHFLRTNIQSLQKVKHDVDVDWYPEFEDVVPEDELLGYVLNLCQCLPFFVEPVSCSAGHVGVFLPLRTAAFYFTDRGHWRWLKWVGEVRNNVFTKGLSPPAVPGRTAGMGPQAKA